MRSLHLIALAAAIAAAGAACGGDGNGGGGPSNQNPTADFTSACTLLACTFTDASTDGDGTIASRSWTFGEAGSGSNTSTEQNPGHTYGAAGTYNVVLTVTDNEGGTDDVTKQVVVTTTPPVNQPPVAAFTVTCLSLDCSFDASTSTDPEGGITTYAWTFSDGGQATGVTATHSFVETGLTTVSATLTVTDNAGASDDVSQDFTVAPPAICEGGACDLTLAADATVRITLSNENCNASGNTLRILAPVDTTLFDDGCHTPVGTFFDLVGPAGAVFTAGTTIEPEVISGSDDLGFTPTLRLKAGTAYPTWVLEFDDGEACPPNQPTCVEPDFDDLEITITATPQ